MPKPYLLTQLNKRSPGPTGEFDSFKEALETVRAWIASQGFVGEEMAAMAGLEIHGPRGLEWSFRAPSGN